MKRQLTRLLACGLSPVNAYPVPATDPGEVESLIKKLHPVATEKKLIRIGPAGDGGYLVPDDLEGIQACFSPGVDQIAGFEKDCADRGMKVYLADKSVEKPPESHPNFSFTKKYIGCLNDDDFMTMDHWVGLSRQTLQADMLLQIDIESFEYESFLSMSEGLLKKFRIIVAEMHVMDLLWDRYYFRMMSGAFRKILQSHSCVHIHPNNCDAPVVRSGLAIPPVMEFTFLRNDRIKYSQPATQFPHPLDADNTPKAHFPLPKCWYHKP